MIKKIVINIFFIVSCFLCSGCTPTLSIQDDDLAMFRKQSEMTDWVIKHYYSILDEYMPIIDGVYAGYHLGYRSYRDHIYSELDYSFVYDIGFFSDDILEVTVRQPVSESLYNQLLILHDANPKHSIERIKKQLKIKSIHIYEKSCPAIRSQYEDFHKTTLPIVKAIEGVIYMGIHRIHHFEIDMSIGERPGHMELYIQDKEHPFVKWAKKTEELLDECIRVGINNGTMKWEQQDLTSK